MAEAVFQRILVYDPSQIPLSNLLFCAPKTLGIVLLKLQLFYLFICHRGKQGWLMIILIYIYVFNWILTEAKY